MHPVARTSDGTELWVFFVVLPLASLFLLRLVFQPYHPDDLKGKGEPSYTIERDSKKMKGRQHLHPDSIEMTAPRRHRSYSNNAAESSSLRVPGQTEAGSSGLHRSNTTGKNNKLSEGLKKRFGSMRRKKDAPTQSVH